MVENQHFFEKILRFRAIIRILRSWLVFENFFSIRAFVFELLPAEQSLKVDFDVFGVCNFEDILKVEFYRIQLCVGVLRGLEDNIDI